MSISATGEIEIYETDDVVPDEPSPHQEDKSVEKFDIDMNTAMRRFGRSYLEDTDGSDFRALASIKREYTADEVFEGRPISSGDITQRFEKLQNDVHQLCQNVDVYKQMARGPSALGISKASVDGLQSMLNLALNEFQHNPATLVKTADFTASNTRTTEAAGSGDEVFLDLDLRLSRIEQALFGKRGDLEFHVPILESVEALKVGIEALNPTVSEIATRKLKKALKMQEEMDEKRSKPLSNDPTLERKIATLYEMMPRIDAAFEGMPAIASRMNSLARLHEQALQFSSRLADLIAHKQMVAKKIIDMSLMLIELKKESQRSLEEIAKKLDKIEKSKKN